MSPTCSGYGYRYLNRHFGGAVPNGQCPRQRFRWRLVGSFPLERVVNLALVLECGISLEELAPPNGV